MDRLTNAYSHFKRYPNLHGDPHPDPDGYQILHPHLDRDVDLYNHMDPDCHSYADRHSDPNILPNPYRDVYHDFHGHGFDYADFVGYTHRYAHSFPFSYIYLLPDTDVYAHGDVDRDPVPDAYADVFAYAVHDDERYADIYDDPVTDLYLYAVPEPDRDMDTFAQLYPDPNLHVFRDRYEYGFVDKYGVQDKHSNRYLYPDA